MAKLNKIRFLLFVSLMVCSSHATEMLLADAQGTTTSYFRPTGSSYVTTIKLHPETIKAVVYICTLSSFQNIMNSKNEEERKAIAAELMEKKHQLLFLGVDSPDGRYLRHSISDFIHAKINYHDTRNLRGIETFGEDSLNNMQFRPYENYNEEAEGSVLLRASLNAMGKR